MGPFLELFGRAAWAPVIRALNMSLQKADPRSVGFVIDRLFMKLFMTNNMDYVRQCQQFLTLNCPVYKLPVGSLNLSYYSV